MSSGLKNKDYTQFSSQKEACMTTERTRCRSRVYANYVVLRKNIQRPGFGQKVKGDPRNIYEFRTLQVSYKVFRMLQESPSPPYINSTEFSGYKPSHLPLKTLTRMCEPRNYKRARTVSVN